MSPGVRRSSSDAVQLWIGDDMDADARIGAGADDVRAVCERYGIAVLLVFGSVARDEAAPDSDIDLLYELRPGVRLGWEIEDLSDELADVFGRPVDLVARTALHPMLEAAVLDEARPVYAA